MKRHYYLYLLSFICLGILLTSCGKKGDVGPQGPAGPIGATGATGIQGVPGNANVKVDTFTVKGTQWQSSAVYWFDTSQGSSQGYVAKFFDRPDTAITSDLLNTGMVLVYFKSATGLLPTTWTPMPFSFTENFDAAYNYNYVYDTRPGSVRLYFFFSKNPGGVPPTLSTYTPPNHAVKIVTISGTVLSAVRKNHIDVNNLITLSKFLGIKN